jgi:uncharacterized membrane protein YagU involved in acid resistance
MTRNLLIRGMIAGLLAGLLAFGFARVFGEPQVDSAIAFEEKMSQAAGEVAEPEIVTRDTQAGLGLFTGVVVYSAAVGGLFSLVFAFVHGRVSSLSPRATAGLLALAGFVAIVLVPAIKYPMNPPAVGNPDTIGARTELFFVMLVVSIAALAAAVGLAKRLRVQHGAWNSALIAGAAYVVFIALVQYLMPAINEVPEQFSPTVLWNFRVASLGIHLIIWTTLGLLFGILAERVLAEHRPRYRLQTAR